MTLDQARQRHDEESSNISPFVGPSEELLLVPKTPPRTRKTAKRTGSLGSIGSLFGSKSSLTMSQSVSDFEVSCSSICTVEQESLTGDEDYQQRLKIFKASPILFAKFKEMLQMHDQPLSKAVIAKSLFKFLHQDLATLQREPPKFSKFAKSSSRSRTSNLQEKFTLLSPKGKQDEEGETGENTQ